ncbi:hypothetical protein BBP40_000337 [Aspergillus hancockii]|nr:hypothetical protein BBP40_000337 [Aspergillus hancockii]
MTQPIPHISNWINGSYTIPTPHQIQVLNPATENPIATIDATPQETVNTIVSSSVQAFHEGKWSKTEPSDRFTVLSTAARLLRTRLPEFVALETSQTGRPVREMQTQLARVPEWLEYFASLARVHEGRVTPFKGPVVNTLTRLPLGVVAQITPYNHPLLIATKKIAAALAAGNVVIVKPSELAPLSVLKLGPLFQEAGLPDGALQIVSGYGYETGKFLCESPLLAKIDLTGGLATYRAIAPVAARNMVPVTAELGGKAPVCLLPSVEVERGVQAALCESEEEMVAIANGTPFALGASVWTNDFNQAHRVAAKIEAGIVWINGHHLNDPSSPWGGFKESGLGKENGLEAYESYTKVKSTVINYGVAPVWFDDEVTNARYG